MDLEQYVKKADLAEKEIEDLTKTIKALLAEKPKTENQKKRFPFYAISRVPATTNIGEFQKQ